ncbi:MAG: hypothetical protein JO268_11925 [Pseudonocardiales bacterium]|nr:hypothetical protein [Pseudonocardiales bacterium]
MRSIEHHAPSTPAHTTPQTECPARYRFAQLFPGDTACASWVGMLPVELPYGGGR